MRHYEFDELNTGSLPPVIVKSRTARLRRLISGGLWGGNDDLRTLYWRADKAKPGGGHWVAWEDPDPLQESGTGIDP